MDPARDDAEGVSLLAISAIWIAWRSLESISGEKAC